MGSCRIRCFQPNTIDDDDDDDEQYTANLSLPSASTRSATMPHISMQVTTRIRNQAESIMQFLPNFINILEQPGVDNPSPELEEQLRETVLDILLFSILLNLNSRPTIHRVPGTHTVSHLRTSPVSRT